MGYCLTAEQAEEFIDHEEIISTIEYAQKHAEDEKLIRKLLQAAKEARGLNHRDAAVLLACENKEIQEEMRQLAIKLKEKIYGNRIVMFAPLYLSNHCVNGCVYCSYHAKNKNILRKQLTQEEIRNEVLALQRMGHRRLAIEAGEDPKHTPLSYILESIETIYGVKDQQGNNAIRRVNVNIAATTEADYKALKAAKIGTYILFQETYHKETYLKLHSYGPKHDYAYHTTAHDRAIRAGLEDVGLGVLFGLSEYFYDFVGLLMHAEHLEALFGIGPHTISLPRIRHANGAKGAEVNCSVSDNLFEKLVMIFRLALPYAGIIISTREDPACRARVLPLGVSQISGGSVVNVGGYGEKKEFTDSAQFEISDTRTLDEVVNWLLQENYIPSFCTACYRKGRTGDRFTSFCRSGQLVHCCQANALLTLKEYLVNYASPSVKKQGEQLIQAELANISNSELRQQTEYLLNQIAQGQSDFYF